MAYQPKHSNHEERADDGEPFVLDLALDDPLKGLVGLLGRIGKQELVNMILLSMIEDLIKAVIPLVSGKSPEEDGDSDPLATALAYDGTTAE